MHKISIGTGELVDRLTITRLKITALRKAKLLIPPPLAFQNDELETLFSPIKSMHADIDAYTHQLFLVNQRLWHLEDQIRENLGNNVDNISILIAITNDIRSHLKTSIDILDLDESAEKKTYKQEISQKALLQSWLDIYLSSNR